MKVNVGGQASKSPLGMHYLHMTLFAIYASENGSIAFKKVIPGILLS
jgi:hypothetical protein